MPCFAFPFFKSFIQKKKNIQGEREEEEKIRRKTVKMNQIERGVVNFYGFTGTSKLAFWTPLDTYIHA